VGGLQQNPIGGQFSSISGEELLADPRQLFVDDVLRPASVEPVMNGLLFHEPWWLAASSGGAFREVTVERGGDVVGRFPFVMSRRLGFRILRMPHFTHVLGPVVNEGKGKSETRLRRRIAIVRELIGKLPPFDYFIQACRGSPCDAVAFQACGFTVRLQGNFQIDCRTSLELILDNMNFKTRGHVRKAENDYTVSIVHDPKAFESFYLSNMEHTGRSDPMIFDNFPGLFAACRERESGEVLAAHTGSGEPVAMVFVVWGGGVMYYLLASRLPGPTSVGAANLLLWSVIKRAHERGLILDLDGIVHAGQMRFLLGFGGQMSSRLIVTRGRPLYYVARYLGQRMQLRGRRSTDTSYFT
jgi:hypothetical protein